MEAEGWNIYQEEASDAPSMSDTTVTPHMPALSSNTYGSNKPAPDLASDEFTAMCAAFFADPEIAQLLAVLNVPPGTSNGDEDEAGTTDTTPSLDAATPTTQTTSVDTPSESSYDAQEHHTDDDLYTQMHQMGLPGPHDLVGFGGPPQGYDYAAPIPAGRMQRHQRTTEAAPHVRGRKRGRESDGAGERIMRPRLEDGAAGPSAHARGHGESPNSGFNPANLQTDPHILWELVHGRETRATEAATVLVPAGDLPRERRRVPIQDANVYRYIPAPEWTSFDRPQGRSIEERQNPDVLHVQNQSGSVGPNADHSKRGRKRTQHKKGGEDSTSEEGSNSQTASAGSSRAHTEEESERAGRRNDVSTAEADLGPGAQKHNKLKSRPSRAIETYARSEERRHESIRIALRVLHQPANAPLPAAHPEAVNEAAMQKIREDEYGVCERVLAHRHKQHKNDSHELDFCVVCGCPMTRGGIVQFARHRKSNCAPWRVLVKIDRYLEWLETAGMIFPNAHKQFFADGVETRAPMHQERLDELRAGEDVVHVQTMLSRGRLFGGMVTKEVEELLVAEVMREMELEEIDD